MHPLASVIVTEYKPAGTFRMSSVEAPLFQTNVYGEEPPMIVRLTAPAVPPKQRTFVMATVPERAVAGWVTISSIVIVHPLESVITAL